MYAIIVDPDIEIGKILCEIFNDYNFVCKVFDDLKEAESFLTTFCPDVLMLDISEKNILHLLPLVNRSQTKIIVTTTALDIDIPVIYWDYYLLKPFNFNELEDIIFKLKKDIDKVRLFGYSERKLNNLTERRN